MGAARKKPIGREDRLKLGREKRRELGRNQLGEFEPGRRKTAGLDTLLSATEGRLLKLLPEKYLRMSASPFAFFRGAVSIMAVSYTHLTLPTIYSV